MKKRILACVVIIVMISVLCSGYASDKLSAPPTDMFEYAGRDTTAGAKIIYDKETKVMYAVANHKSITLLVDENGKPKLWKE